MALVSDLINQSLLLAGMRASGETPEAALSQDALTVLNQMISGWNNESLLIYAITRTVVTMTASKQTYTVGAGGDVNIQRAPQIEAINWRDETQSPPLELPLAAMEDAEYQNLRLRDLTASMPTKFFYDRSFPLSTLFLWPTPTVARKLVLFVWTPWSYTYGLTDTISFPPGYERMLVYNLAVELSAQPSARITPATAALAEESKMRIQALNAVAPIMQVDGALLSGTRRAGAYNYVNDESH
jgi:hypothetical protein